MLFFHITWKPRLKETFFFSLQDPNEDTEWNDILRKKGILPPKETPKEDEEEELALQQQSVGKRDQSFFVA